MSEQLDLFAPRATVVRPFLDEVRASIAKVGGFHCDSCGEFAETSKWDDVKLCMACRGAA